jgi:hypothetical protein
VGRTGESRRGQESVPEDFEIACSRECDPVSKLSWTEVVVEDCSTVVLDDTLGKREFDARIY